MVRRDQFDAMVVVQEIEMRVAISGFSRDHPRTLEGRIPPT
jgi:hypothetical protein